MCADRSRWVGRPKRGPVFAPAIQKGVGHIAPPPPSGPKKVAIIGSAPTVQYAPWFDESYQIWTHAICMGQCKRVDRMFEMHPPLVWRDHVKPQWPKYYDYLKSCPYPIYMQEKYPDVPNSVRYPKERIFAQCRAMIGRYHFGSQADFMIALALSEGIRHIAGAVTGAQVLARRRGGAWGNAGDPGREPHL
jgi:hypothetical protein